MGRTLLDKIWDAHTVRTEEGGRTVLYIDRQYIHEVTSPVAFAGLARRGVGVVHPDRITATVDHNIPTVDQHLPIAEPQSRHQVETLRANCARYGIEYDEWFFESSLHESGFVADTVSELTERGFTYEKDGALWLATSRILGDELRAAGKSEKDIEKLDLKDDVLRRANGFYTYFAADIAYHRNKLAVRGFDRAINIWGADHHGHVARLKGALDALGLDGQHRLEIVLMQLVKLMRDGEVVRMSKRTGKAISLGDLLDEIPVDAARWFFNSRPDTQMDFDLGLAVREDSENPAYSGR